MIGKTMPDMSDFQKQFLSKGVGNELFTQKEFDDELALAKAEIMTMAIEASRTAVMMEREYCAQLVDKMADDEEEGEVCTAIRSVAEAIRNRIPSQVKQ
jgi:hypothetical protein